MLWEEQKGNTLLFLTCTCPYATHQDIAKNEKKRKKRTRKKERNLYAPDKITSQYIKQ